MNRNVKGINMIYDYNHYNDPAKGNKHIYPYGVQFESLEFCGFIYADNINQAKIVLTAYNNAWNEDCSLLDYLEEDCREELKRREIAKNEGNG